MFEPVGGERFDLIVSNPPFVIGAGEQRYEYRDSGFVGDGICEQLIRAVADHLNPGGTAQLLANWMVHGGLRLAGTDRQLGGRHRLDAWVVQREIADPAEYVALWLPGRRRDHASGRRAAARPGWTGSPPSGSRASAWA